MRPQKILFICVALVLLALGSAQAQSTLYVDCDNGDDVTGNGTVGNPYGSIQATFLNHAADGDTIRVLPSTCNECVELTTNAAGELRAVDLVADAFLQSGDNTATTINATGLCAPNVAAVNVHGIGASLTGFTVTGGAASGVFGRGSVAITSNVITGNSSSFGGGIYIYTASCYYDGSSVIEITDNDINNNSAAYEPGLTAGGDGGGVYVLAVGSADPGCKVCSGGVDDGLFCIGGGDCDSGACVAISSGDAQVTLQGNTITSNTIQGNTGGFNVPFGGGLVVYTFGESGATTASVTVTQNVITDNSAAAGSTSYGGGAWVQTYGYGNETIIVDGNTIAQNSSTGDGGGISAWSQSLDVANHSVVLNNNTITGNSATGNGGGIDMFMLAGDLLPTQSISLRATNNRVTGNSSSGTLGGAGGILGSLFSERSDGAVTNIQFDISGNRVTNNTSSFMGGGIGLIISADADPDIGGTTNKTDAAVTLNGNLVADNQAVASATAPGGGVFAYLQSFGEGFASLDMSRNTIVNNQSNDRAGGINIEQCADFDAFFNFEGTNTVNVDSSIVALNDGFGIGGPDILEAGEITPGAGCLAENYDVFVDYSDLFGNLGGNFQAASWLTSGVSSISSDPLLAGPLYLPDVCSPTLDSADPALDFSLEPQPNGGRANMGYTGGTATATSSLADVNLDGIIDGVDVVQLSTAFGSSNGQARFRASADLDGSDMVDGLDLSYIAAQFGDTCQ